MMKTADLVAGTQVLFKHYQDESDYSQQLRAVGLIEGTVVQVIRRAPLGDPIEISFRGINLALRQSEADRLEWEAV